MKLSEVLFTTQSRDSADALAAHLSGIGYEARVVPGDGSKTFWQVRAVEWPLREFGDVVDCQRFLDETLQPLADEFAAHLAGGSLSYGDGVGTFSIGISQPRPDN